MRRGAWISVVLVIVLAGTAAWWWWRQPTPPIATVPVEAPASQAAMAPPAASAAVSGIQHPIETPSESGAAADPKTALVDLFGARVALSLFHLDDFPHRFAATADNLGRSSAPSRVWPVVSPSGRFIVEKAGDGEVIAADNSLRYAPFVLMVESVDAAHLAATYRRLYPLLQQAYEDLGYPGRYLNDRVVAVIDILLATPAIDARPKVHLPTIDPSVHPERPWVLYQFDDPALESLTAGQKMLLRMGPENERRLKAKLVEIRRLLATPKAPR
jgi:hypothetical protein